MVMADTLPEVCCFAPLLHQALTGASVPVPLEVGVALRAGTQPVVVAIEAFQGLDGRAVQLTAVLFQEIAALGSVKIGGDQALVAFKRRG